MKLRNKDRTRLQSTLDHLKRGLDFVASERVAVMVKHNMGSCDFFASQYTPYAGQKWAPINKQVGSELCLAFTALRELETLLAEQDKPQSEQEPI